MSVKDVTDFQKNLIGWIGISIILIGGLITMHTRINENALGVSRNEQVIHKLQEDNRKVYDLMNQMRLENSNSFHELKLILTTKQDKKD